MKLALDHARYASAKPRFLASAIVMALLAVLLIWQLMNMRAEQAVLQQQLTSAQQASQPVQAARIQPQSLSSTQKAEIKEANQVLNELGRPWPALLSRLEQVAKPEVALLAIRPDAAKGKLRLKGEAKDIAALLAYIQRLEAVPEMHDVVLDEHELMEKPQDGGMAHFIRFGVTARWGAI